MVLVFLLLEIIQINLLMMHYYQNMKKIILDAIYKNIKITRLELSLKIDRSERTVQRITNSLVAKGFIERIGNNRFGYWEVK